MTSGASESQAVQRDAADLLYRNGVLGVLVSALTSSSIAFFAVRQVSSRAVVAWWAAFIIVLALRGLDILIAKRSGHGQIVRFGIGVIASGILWAVFTLLFLRSLNLLGRTSVVIVLCGMIGGSATVLAPSRVLAITYCALLALPAAYIFLTTPGVENTVLGIIGCTYFAVVSASSGITRRATMAALQLSRANERLVLDMTEERQRTEAANANLNAAQSELREANRLLESRVKERTTDLEREIRDKEGYARKLAHLASTDSLTGLSNRATLALHLSEALENAARTAESVAVLFLDLDKFKEVNDVLGHIAGDRVLQAVADRLSTNFGNVKVARWGGDEFVVVVQGVESQARSLELGKALRERVAAPIELDRRIVTIDATIGIAMFPQHAQTQEQLIWAADVAMFAGKENRNSRIKLFDAELNGRLVHRHLLEQALREAIPSQTLSLVFQPVLKANPYGCDSMESLIRWHHPRLGILSPTEFIPIAERIGEIVDIGRWVLREACREAVSWPGDVPPAVSVNFSATQIEAGALVADVLAALEETHLPASRLHLELTESIFATDQSSATAALAELRAHGVKILLDDFGTGFSCLAYLRRLPVDRIKIDKSFVAGIHSDSGPIVKSIVTTAQAFGLQVVAEGVETEEQAETLIAMGAQYLQGHLFSGPLSSRAARDWLLAHCGLERHNKV
jgi:diguanylate cyclase (GGDEF)-like protein